MRHILYSLQFLTLYRMGCVCVCVTCVMNLLCDVDSLSVGQSSVHRSSCSWSECGIEGIDVEAQVDGPRLPVTGNSRYFSFTRIYITNCDAKHC